MRKYISILLGLILLVGAVMISKKIIANKKKPKPTFAKIAKTVFISEVNNTEIPVIIKANGNLTAQHKMQLFTEVQGILKSNIKEFKAGTSYKKGETILTINSEEFLANIQSQKSNFNNSIIAIMPDIRLDYPNEYQKWKKYLKDLDISKKLPELPGFNSDKEKYFIAGKGINTTYYAIKNLEVKLEKYNITAPYDGVVTEALVTHGTLVRIGQQIGEFINTSAYEMEVAINAEFSDLLKIGNSVKLQNTEQTKEYIGTVIRVNGKVDAISQTVKAYIKVAHKDLKEGLFLEADLNAKTISNATEISRKLLINGKQLFVVSDTILKLIDINPIYFSADKVIVKGIKNGTKILSKPVLSAYDGMLVTIFENKKK